MRTKLLPSCLTLCNPMTEACQAPLSMGFSRQDHWSGLPCPPPGDRPNLGIKPVSLTWHWVSKVVELQLQLQPF